MTMGHPDAVTLTIIGKPVPYVRMTQRGKWVRPDAQRYLASKARIAEQMREQMGTRAPFGREPLSVTLDFCYSKGADHRRDLDNEIKALLDAANGIVYEDDRWIDGIIAWRGDSTRWNAATECVYMVVEKLNR
jgi:crossover junction endodeoxyribonuclease RusA